MKTNMLNRIAIAIAAGLVCGLASAADDNYPGNPNFRNVPFVNTALTRTNWHTNILDSALSKPLDWSVGETLSPGVDFIPAVLTKDAGWPTNTVCYFVRIDLTTPGLRFTGTDRCPDWGDPMPEEEGAGYAKRTVREKTTDFLVRNRGAKSKGGKERDAVLAWNNSAWLPWTTPYTNLWGCPYSPLYSDGVHISNYPYGRVAIPYADNVPAPQAMFVEYKDRTFDVIGYMSEADSKRTWFSAPGFVTGLVTNGQWQDLDNGSVEPRTAIGISLDRRYFYLVVCDGRLGVEWSGGCDFTSLSKILSATGCWIGFNLDGGGSATLCAWNEATGKPDVLNRPCYGLRDNGSNAAIYYSFPVAMVGSYIYDDMDFLVQDIVDGETPDGETTVNVLDEALFTAEHPCIPAGTAWTISSTNGASIGWADGVAPQVAAGSTVTLRGIRVLVGTNALSVASGGKVVLDGVPELAGIASADASGIEIAGAVPVGIRVACAAAPNLGNVFATSSLPLAAAKAEAAKIVCSADPTTMAEAFEDGGVVKFRWSKAIRIGGRTGKIADTLDRGVVSVRVTDCAADYASGYRLRLTVESEDGQRVSTEFVDFAGPGTYSFDTLDSSDPTICASGYVFGYKVELVDSDGAKVPNSEFASGTMRVGVRSRWFSARAADDSATGGSWTAKPDIEEGRFVVAEDSEFLFAADEPRSGRVRYETHIEFRGFIPDFLAEQMLASAMSACGMPHGACFVAKGDAKETPVWRALVSENGAPAFRTLIGPAALNTPCKLVCEVDSSSGAPFVRYSVAVGDGPETVLVDADGVSWFRGVSPTNEASGHVLVKGVGSVSSIDAAYLQRRLEKYFRITIK